MVDTKQICISSFCTFLGFLPQLELRVEAPLPVNNIKWDHEISFEEAYKAIEEKFYGFKKVVPYKKSPRLLIVYIPCISPFHWHNELWIKLRPETLCKPLKSIGL